MQRQSHYIYTFVVGLAAAVLFAALAGTNLAAQGPQYDELHQAVGAFTWLGAPPPPAFCLDFRGVCVLNTTYSAALKTNLYGLFLRLSGRGFVLTDWRRLGIVVISVGVFLFAMLARSALKGWALAVFFVLLVSDGTLLLLGRFDWGPIALALLLRLAMLGLWLRGEAGEQPPQPANSFALGAVVGLATFEKLSSVVLLLPLAAMVLLSARRRTRSHLLAAGGGLALGFLPLLAVNFGWLMESGELISLRNLGGTVLVPPSGFLREVLTLGNGGGARVLMLGLGASPPGEILEAMTLVATCLLAGFAAFRWRSEAWAFPTGVALVSYLAIGVGLYFLPRQTWAHHWILATPFQYVAVALAFQGLLRDGSSRSRRIVALALAGLVAVWAGLRLPGLVSLEHALLAGRSSAAWDPSLTGLGTFAARHADEAIFVASDWGVATQIHCFANGRPGLVHEPFWDYQGVRQLHDIQDASGKEIPYLVRLRRGTERFAATRRIEQDLAADPRWREVPVDPMASGLTAVLVNKLVSRRDSSGAKPNR